MIPQAQVAEIRAIGQEIGGAWRSRDKKGVQRSSLYLHDIAPGTIQDRTVNPRDPGADLTRALPAAADADGAPDLLNLGTIRQVLVAGIIALCTFVGSVVVHSRRLREHHQRITEDPGKIRAVAAEPLRRSAPYRGFARPPTRDTEFGGPVTRRDQAAALCFAAAIRGE